MAAPGPVEFEHVTPILRVAASIAYDVGPWLDEEGVRWSPRPGGTWVRVS